MTPEDQQSIAIRARLQKIARLVKAELPNKSAFILLAGPQGAGGRMEYVANIERFDALQLMRQFVVVNNTRYMEHVKEGTEPKEKAFAKFWVQLKGRIEYLSPEQIARDTWQTAQFEIERFDDLTTYTAEELKDLALAIVGELDRREKEEAAEGST